MDALRQWLEGLGLEQYAGVLDENDIGLEVLPELTDGDLEKLGLSLGHRRKLLKALAALPREAPEHRGREATPITTVAHDAERRQVTVLFCDLVGSTELANSIDPEDMGELLRRYQDRCAGAIARFDGMVGNFLGDGVLAYFGYPQAHEDAAERSVHAALAMIDSIKQVLRPDGRAIEARVGIATGIVVIGDIIGAGVSREHAIVGETPNLAARLQALAEPNCILVSPGTRRLLGNQFEFRALGAHPLKGFAKPIEIWQVVRAQAVQSRFAAGGVRGRGSFVGREQELGMLLDRWRMATRGNGQALFIAGDAGIGKSRLVAELSEQMAEDSHLRVLCQCSPYHTNSALHPLIQYLERAADFAPDDPPALKLEKLEALLEGTGDEADSSFSLIADLLSLPAGTHAPSELLPAQRKTATISALVEQISHLAQRQPILFVLEDAHWADPSTRDLITDLIAAVETMRVFLVATTRPDQPPWKARDLVTSLRLNRLDKAQCAEVVSGMFSGRPLAASLVEDIVAKTDGVPLFLEELTKAVMESDTPDRPAVPATLHDSLMARLDRLGAAKEIAQIAAVVGPQFSSALLEKVAAVGAAELASGLERLVEGGIILQRGRGSDAILTFKHALMRDVSYESLLRTRRQQIHERIGRALEEHFPDEADSQPEFLAHHFRQAGIADRASTYRERAGDRAVGRYAYAEAVAHFSAGLADAQQLALGPNRTQRELVLLLKLGPALSIMTGPHNPEVEATYARAHEIAKSNGDEATVFKAIWGLWFTAFTSRKLEAAHARGQELLALGRQSSDPDLLLEAFHCAWATANHRGDHTTALRRSREGLERYDRVRDAWMGEVFGGHDPGVCAHCTQATTFGLQGNPVQSRKSTESAVSLAEFLKHPPSLTIALNMAMVAAQISRDHEAVDRYSARMLEHADRYSFASQRAHSLFHSGWARAYVGDPDGGLAVMEAEFPRVSPGMLYWYYAALVAETSARSGKVSEALAVLEAALATVTESVGLYVPELHRLQGECLLQLDASNFEIAVQAILTAADIAKRQNAPLLQLRAGVSMARACAAAHQAERGLTLLREIHATLPDGFEAAELDEARQLLAA